MKKKQIALITIFAIIFILASVKVITMLSDKETRDRLIAAARRLLDRPVRVEMDKRPGSSVQAQKKIPDEILVDDFVIGQTSGVFSQRKNRVGSYQGTWAMRPSFSIITKTDKVRHNPKGQSLVIDYRKESGWAGYYSLLNNIDVTPYNTLSFWVRGENGGEKFDIGLADARMQALEIDAFFLGCATSFIKDGFVTKEWKEVKVPLARASSEIDLSKMGSFVLWFKYGGAGRIYIQDIKFKNDPEIANIEEYNAPQAPRDLVHPRSLWVWKIDPVSNKTQRKDLFQLCKRGNIEIVYLFFPEFTEMPEPQYLAALAEYLKESHAHGIKVEALTGNPVWSLAQNHHLLTNWIKFFLEYNKDKPQEQRLDGISLDVEPYLTAEWEKDRERIKRDYIELLKKCRKLIDSYKQDFKVGVAIPFFYDKEDDGQFERQILQQVDYLALMAYYDIAKDIIDKSVFHVKLASEMNRKVFIALETQDLVEMRQGKRRNTFIEEGWEEMERQLDKVKKAFMLEPGFGGFAMHHYDSYKIMTRGRNVPTKERLDNYVIKARKAKGEVLINGKLDGWDLNTPFAVNDKKHIVYGSGAWTSPQDLALKVYTMWDTGNFYIALDVTDDKVIQQKSGADMWEGDHVELWLDVDLEGDRTEAMNSDDDFQIGLSPGNFSDIPPDIYIWTPTIPEGIRYKELIAIGASRTTTGYVVTAKIPKEVLFCNVQTARVGVEPKPGGAQQIFKMESQALLGLQKGFRMGMMIDIGDTDDLANPMKCLLSTSIERIWGDPTSFGVVELEGDES
ncbi:MAG: sugar-binding protein [Candidatus Omnitrophota bacterium]